ncbi:hypothetical protein M3Y97_00163900 [Aphelenchoides bicaudatus]|nr:hypothetical protein M3Y97_00163900 [Aphelenchoides bicaudatus]
MVSTSRDFCLCGVHVHAATRVIAIAFIALSSIAFLNDIIGYVRQSQPATVVLYGIFGNVLVCSFNIFLLYGNTTKRENFYWPFIVFHILSVILGFIVAGLLLIFGTTIFSVIESLPKELPANFNLPEGSKDLLSSDTSNEKYHAPKPYYGQNFESKFNLNAQLEMQKEYEAVRQFTEAIGTSVSCSCYF